MFSTMTDSNEHFTGLISGVKRSYLMLPENGIDGCHGKGKLIDEILLNEGELYSTHFHY
jgi:hypothetical protein